ncbi:nucleoside transporter C-terminal domain-containing protein [Paraflavitalea sp. CAU 1676]|uniref:NupC/NupG family nucleoside CNT transporter n=1 Tax=Paraflavitalea sp. CAU 1676 TaxID=3032598 RepID=UPI0023DC1CC5|nr:nucleoside transporter C-terminal domain-containing protein [Paraflavitalea sp. CAU 1676]MDF2187807.1 nucleoside transporter C-terminal domain-containing protein [Paraflavitalea sp. CAU 1676]
MNPVLVNISRGALGMFFLILVCYLLSNNRRAINWKLVGMGLFAQVMFAMGVLHTTVFGQPVFWLLFGVILAYTIFHKYNRVKNKVEGNIITYDTPHLLLAVIWQVILVVGLILAPTLYGKWSGLSIFISCIVLLALIFRIGKKYGELMKWSILLSCVLLTGAVYSGVCNPQIFKIILQSVSDVFVSLINISHKGTEFMFGNLADANHPWAYVFAIQVLPNIIFFAALSSILYYLGVLQVIVYVFAYLLNKLKISGAESLSTAANIFLGQTEAPLMIRPYLDKMTRSEILCIMIGGMANTAGSVLAAYVGFLGGTDIDQQHYFALHMLSQSIMSAPAAIVCSKILFPQTDEHMVSKDLTVPKEKLGDNFLDALSLGTTDGLKLAVNVGAMLIVFTAMMWVVNGIMGWVGGITHLNEEIAASTGGRYQELSLQMVLGYLFSPVAWLIGVSRADMVAIGQLLGEKTILNEFVAYISLGQMKANNVIQDPKSLLIATYALCGFANFASIGIQIGGISQLAPSQRKNLTELGVKALIGGTIACLMCGCVAGALS